MGAPCCKSSGSFQNPEYLFLSIIIQSLPSRLRLEDQVVWSPWNLKPGHVPGGREADRKPGRRVSLHIFILPDPPSCLILVRVSLNVGSLSDPGNFRLFWPGFKDHETHHFRSKIESWKIRAWSQLLKLGLVLHASVFILLQKDHDNKTFGCYYTNILTSYSANPVFRSNVRKSKPMKK